MRAFGRLVGGMGSKTSERSAGGRSKFDKTTLFYAGLAVVSALLVAVMKSPAALWEAVRGALLLIVAITPMVAIGLFLGGLVKSMTDPQKIGPILGAQSGLRGLVLATGLGAVTPGGPFAAFPIVYGIFAAGADVGAVVAYLTGWSLIAVHRVVVWEMPLIGPDFAMLRVLVSLPLPVLAGALARILAERVSGLRVDAGGAER